MVGISNKTSADNAGFITNDKVNTGMIIFC